MWPIFNLADAPNVIGGALGAVLAVRGIEFDGRRSYRADATASRVPTARAARHQAD